MKKEILINVISAVVGGTLVAFALQIGIEFDAHRAATAIVEDDDLRGYLIDKLADDPQQRFRGQPGKNGASVATPKSGALVESIFVNGRDVVKEGVPKDWFPVPRAQTTNMEIALAVDESTDAFLVSYVYRVSGLTPTGHAWSGIEVLGNNGEQFRFYHGEGSAPGRSDGGFSGSVVVESLPNGDYTLRLMDHAIRSGTRRYTHQRQLSVVRIR
ncbi:MAG: hypothetical protein K0U98_27455 [Deltaproteobacteria bacterium]|nr:hypothetical protein [Deltaproteobacteria bacterium]